MEVDVFQIHWQKPGIGNEHVTEFVVQGSVLEMESKGINPIAWIARRIEDKRETCPKGWFPLIVWGDHPRMVLGKAETDGGR